MGKYNYTATAVAEGGEDETVTQTIWITGTCFSTAIDFAQYDYYYDIPEFN